MCLIRSNGTSSSSATSCFVAVTVPWPSSTLPVFITTVPSERIASHESIWPGSTDTGPTPTGSSCGRYPSGGISGLIAPSAPLGAPIATTRAAVPFRNVRRLNRCSVAVIVIVPTSRGGRLRGLLDRGQDAVVRPAPAQVLVHQRLDLLVARLRGDRSEPQERRGAHHHRARAVPALRGLVVDERGLERVRLLRRAQALERCDRVVGHRADRRHARPDRLVAVEDGARPALRESATKPRTMQPKLVPQHVQERRVDG